MDRGNYSRMRTQNSHGDDGGRMGLPRVLVQSYRQIGKGTIEQPTLTSRFEWLTKQKNYQLLTNKEIDQEYQRLRKGLLALNAEAAKIVTKFNSKAPRKAATALPDQAWQLCEKEKENNAAIIARLRNELENLKGRAGSMGPTSKYDLDDQIDAIRQKIKKVKRGNKELQRKSKDLGEKIGMGDAIFDTGRQLQMESIQMGKKLNKLQDRWQETQTGLQNVHKSLEEIAAKAESADVYFAEKTELLLEEKGLEESYKQRKGKKEAISHNIQSIANVKQQKYLKLLRQLEEATSKMQNVTEAIVAAEQAKERKEEELRQIEGRVRKTQESRKRRRQLVQEEHQRSMFCTQVEPISTESKVGKSANSRYNIQRKKSKDSPERLRQQKIRLSQNRTQQVRVKAIANSTTLTPLDGGRVQEKKKERTESKQPYLTIGQQNYPTRRSLQASYNKNPTKTQEQLFKTVSQQPQIKLRQEGSSKNRPLFEGRRSLKVVEKKQEAKATSVRERSKEEVDKCDVIAEVRTGKEVEVAKRVQNGEGEKKDQIGKQLVGQVEGKEESDGSDESYDFEEEIKRSRESWASSRLKIDIQLGEIGQNLKKRESAFRPAQHSDLDDEVIEENEH